VELRRKYNSRNQLLGLLFQRKLTITCFNTSFIHFYFNNLSFRPRRKTTNDKLIELTNAYKALVLFYRYELHTFKSVETRRTVTQLLSRHRRMSADYFVCSISGL